MRLSIKPSACTSRLPAQACVSSSQVGVSTIGESRSRDASVGNSSPRAPRPARPGPARRSSERPGADILAVVLEQVVRHHDDRHLGQDRLGHGLAADPPLELGERQDAVVLPGEDLAVDDRAVGQGVADRRELGIALGDQLLAARPEEGLPAAADELRSGCRPTSIRPATRARSPSSSSGCSRA